MKPTCPTFTDHSSSSSQTQWHHHLSDPTRITTLHSWHHWVSFPSTHDITRHPTLSRWWCHHTPPDRIYFNMWKLPLCSALWESSIHQSESTHTHTHTPPHHRWFKHFSDESFKLWNMFWVLFWFHFFVFLMNYFINANTWRNFLTMQLISFFLSKPKFMSLLSVQLVTQCSGSLLRVIKPLWTHIPSCRPRNSREAALWPVNAVKLCGQSSGTKLHSEKEKIGCFCFLARFCWRTNTTRTSLS